MFSLKRSHSKTTYAVLIDVGSASVGISIAASDLAGKRLEILFSHREYVRVRSEKIKPEEEIVAIRQTLLSALLILSTEGMQALGAYDEKGRIKHVHVSCASPWGLTVLRKIGYTHESETKITKGLIEDVIEGAEKEVEAHVGEAGVAESLGLNIIERATVNYTLNGYPVDNPIGLTGKTLEMLHMTGYMPHMVSTAVAEAQEKILPDTTLHQHTDMLIAYCVLQELAPEHDSFCIVHVTGEATEIGVVEKGVLVATHHTLFGSNTLIRSVVKELGDTPDHTVSILRAYHEKTLAEGTHSKVKTALATYNTTISDALATIAGQHPIPRTIVIHTLPTLANFLKEDVRAHIEKVTGQKHDILETNTYLHARELGQGDDFLELLAHFFHKLDACGQIHIR